MVTLASTIEELEIDGLGAVERLGLINALWDTVANDPAVATADSLRNAGLRRWLGEPAANCDPDGDEIDDEILAGITCRI